nr:branched-chain amino acid transport system II carrier protein [Shewanella shenzhenensis]
KSFDVNDTSALSQAVVDFAAWVAPVMSKFPLYDQGMAWLVPTLVSVVICIIIGHNTRPATTHAQ